MKGDLDTPCWWQGGRGLGDDPRWWRPAGARDEHGAMTRGREGAGKVKEGEVKKDSLASGAAQGRSDIDGS